MILQQDLIQCIRDTYSDISPSAASRMRGWLQYPVARQVTFIQHAIKLTRNQSYCAKLQRNGSISLENIVLKHKELFTPEDIVLATYTLSIK